MTDKKKQIEQLFRDCLILRRQFNEIEKDLENIHDIAMNAAVAAGQTGSLMRIFSEIANQISQTIRRMNQLIPSLRDEVNHTMNSILRILVIERRLEKYQLAARHIQQERNKLLLQQIISRQYQHIAELGSKAYHYLNVVETMIRTLRQHYQRLYASHELLKMESTHLYGGQSEAMLQMADNFAKVTDRGSGQIEDITAGIRHIKAQILKFQHLLSDEEYDAKALAI
ncbi:MAG: hypothetical protein ACOH5I_19730 [Oligoflexus sp.]